MYSIDRTDAVEVVFLVTCPKSGSGLFCRKVPLRFPEHFISRSRLQFLTLTSEYEDVPDEELAHAGATQQWRVEVQVQMNIGIFIIYAGGCCRCRELVNSHRISKRAREEVIVSLRQLRENLRKSGFLLWGQVQNRGDMPVIRSDCFLDLRKTNSTMYLTRTKYFVWPDCPPWNYCHPVFVLQDDSPLTMGYPDFKVCVFQDQAGSSAWAFRCTRLG